MKPLAALLLASGLILSSSARGAQAEPGTAEQQFAALMKEYGPVSGLMRQAKTDWERKAAVESLAAYPAKFLELAEAYPHDPIALKALREAVQAMSSTDSLAQVAWETNRADFPAGNTDALAARTTALLLRDHLQSDALAPVCDRLRYSYRLPSADFLRAVLEQSPHRHLRGIACLGLARFLSDRLAMVNLAADRPELARCYDRVFGSDYLPALRRLQQEGLAAQTEAMFERAAADYGDVAFHLGGTIGDQARAELHGIRHLAVGRPAQETAGRDQDGAALKLSDYRGKAVLLYFWMEYCPT